MRSTDSGGQAVKRRVTLTTQVPTNVDNLGGGGTAGAASAPEAGYIDEVLVETLRLMSELEAFSTDGTNSGTQYKFTFVKYLSIST